MTIISLEELRENFDYFDNDGSGKLSKSEFAALMDALGMAESPENMSIGFRAIDTDGSGLIEFEEFAAWFNSQ